ncbi:MAG: chorismate synthase, partial [Deltaproteobacteria bacterium]|nr:chorismate synthase [Deltaproteobacteria bacterium]
QNRDADSRPYEILRQLFRPGHADYSYHKKYGHVDFRGGGRASARETAARVAAGVVAAKILEPLGTRVTAYTIELGGIRAENIDLGRMDESPFYCPDLMASKQMEEAASEARKTGDSIGGIVEILVNECPAGFGEPVFDKLEADLAKAVMSVGAVKGIEIGAGFGAARLKGSENNDPITPNGFASNHAGGILGGISNGDDIILRAAVKPIPSISLEQDTIDKEGHPAKLKISGRHDATAIPRIVPVLEAMVRIVLADHYLRLKVFQ